MTCLLAQELTVYGKIINPSDDKVYVAYYKDRIAFERIDADTASLNLNGEFAMQFKWTQPGFAEFFHGNEYTNLFLCPGDSLRIELDAQKFDQTVVHSGKGSNINNYLASKMLIFPAGPPNHYQLPETQFLHYVDSVRGEKLNFYERYFAQIKSQDPSLMFYKKTEEAEIEYAYLVEKLNYPDYQAYFKGQQDPVALSSNYYDFLKKVNLNNPDAMESNSYLFFVRSFIDREVYNSLKKDSTWSSTILKQQLIDQQLKGEIKSFILAEYAYHLFSRTGNLEDGKKIYDSYLAASKNKLYKEMLDKAYGDAEKIAKGKPAADFTLKDLDGKLISLKDFKGKIVYMDIWASWCGPCIREVPYAKKLEAELHEKDIVFLNVSIDENLDAWKKAVKEKEIKGVHINSKGGSEAMFANLYQVNGIPRYYIIDRNGNIFDNNAKRPSGNVKEDLEVLLMGK